MIFWMIAMTLGLISQIVIFLWLRPSRLIGDEVEYAPTKEDTRHRPVWARVPLHVCFVRISERLIGARNAMSLISLVSVGLATAFVNEVAGSLAAASTAIMLLFSIERLILSMHLWPDISMGLVLLCAGVLLHDYSADNMNQLAIVAAVGLGIRIEGAILCLVAAALPAVLADATLTEKLIPTLILLGFAGLYCAINRLLLGHWALDTTFGFNLRVARMDLLDPSTPLSTLMQNAVHSYKREEGKKDPSSKASKKQNARAVIQLFSRMKSLLGPETFVTQNLIENNLAGYANPQFLRHTTWGNIALRYGFTICYFATLLVLPFAPMELVLLLMGATIVYCGIQTRSRYRMSLIPLMSVVFGLGIVSMLQNPVDFSLAYSAVAVSAFSILLWFSKARRERPEQLFIPELKEK